MRSVEMRKAWKCLGVLALCAASQLAALSAHAEVIAGRVVKVADGDTITVLDLANTLHKIRLAGIDAPEKKQAFGNASRLSLAQLVAGQAVRVETDKVDRYGRSVGVVLVSGVDVNRTQLERGMAWWYRAYAREQSPADQAAYSRAEDDARSARRGLWVDKEPIAPWDWRRSARHGVQLEFDAAGHGHGVQKQGS